MIQLIYTLVTYILSQTHKFKHIQITFNLKKIFVTGQDQWARVGTSWSEF